MSLLTDLEHGRISPQQFITLGAADLQKDLGFLLKFPGAQRVVTGALNLLEGQLTRFLSPTLAALLVSEIESLLFPQPVATLAPQPEPGGAG